MWGLWGETHVLVYFAFLFSFNTKMLCKMRMKNFPDNVPGLSPSSLTFSQTCFNTISKSVRVGRGNSGVLERNNGLGIQNGEL